MTRTHATHTAAHFATVQQRQAQQAQREEARRKASIKALKACVRQLGMDDGTYRAMLQARTGHTSATQCTVVQLGTVIAHLKAAGATPPPKVLDKSVNADGRRRLASAPDRAALHAKVVTLLQELARVTGHSVSLAYADAICKKNGWCERVDFADPVVLHQLVGALARTLKWKTAQANRSA